MRLLYPEDVPESLYTDDSKKEPLFHIDSIVNSLYYSLHNGVTDYPGMSITDQ